MQTVGEYLNQWLQLQRSQLQPSTWESYRTYVVHYLAPSFADAPLADLTATQLSTFYASLQQGVGVRVRPLALRTIQYCHGVIHKALADAVRLEILPRNVAANAILPRIDIRGDGVKEVSCWSAEELRRFPRPHQGLRPPPTVDGRGGDRSAPRRAARPAVGRCRFGRQGPHRAQSAIGHQGERAAQAAQDVAVSHPAIGLGHS